MKKLTIYLLLCLFAHPLVHAQINNLKGRSGPGPFANYGYAYSPNNGNIYFYHTAGIDTVIPITDAIFEKADYFTHNGLAMAKKEGKYGYIDTAGNTVIPFIYDNATTFANNVAIVFYNCKTGILDDKGNLITLPKEYEHVFAFKENRAIVVDKELYGAIDKKGNEIIAPQYGYMASYQEGLSVYHDTTIKMNGVLDTNGKVVIKPAYGAIANFHEGMADISLPVGKKGEQLHGYINNKGEVLVPVKYSYVYIPFKSAYYNNDAYAGIRQPKDTTNRPFFFIAENYKHNRRKKYFEWDYFKEKVLSTTVYNNTGNVLLTLKKTKIYSLSRTIFYYQYKNNTVLLTTSGKMDTLRGVVNIDYFDVIGGDTLLKIFNAKKLEGIITKQGKVILPAAYKYIGDGEDDRYYFASTDDSTRVYDIKTFTYLRTIKGKVSYAMPFYLAKDNGRETMVTIVNVNNKVGLLDENHNVLIPPTTYYSMQVEDRHILFEKEGKFGIMNNKLEEVVPARFTWLDDMYVNNYRNYNKNGVAKGLYKAWAHKKAGIVDTLGNLIVDTLYTYLNCIVIDGFKYYYAAKNKKHGLLDSTGKVIIDFKYSSVFFNGKQFSARLKNKEQLFTRQGKPVDGFGYKIVTRGYAYHIVEEKHKQGAIDTTGKLVIPIVHDKVYESGNYFYCYNNKKVSLLDTQGNVIIPPLYSYLYVDARNTVHVKQGKNFGIITLDNKEVLPSIYSSVYYNSNMDVYNIARIVKKKRLNGIAGPDGKIIIPADYEPWQINYHDKTIVLTMADGKRYFYNNKGETVNDCYIDKSIGGR